MLRQDINNFLFKIQTKRMDTLVFVTSERITVHCFVPFGLLSGVAAAPCQAVLRMPGGGGMCRALCHLHVSVPRQKVLVFHKTGE